MPQSEVLVDRIGIKDYQRAMRTIYTITICFSIQPKLSPPIPQVPTFTQKKIFFYYNFYSTNRLLAFVSFSLTNCMSPSLQVGIIMSDTVPSCKRCLVRISYHLFCKGGTCFISAICIYLRILLSNIIIPSQTKLLWDIVTLPSVRPSVRP